MHNGEINQFLSSVEQQYLISKNYDKAKEKKSYILNGISNQCSASIKSLIAPL